MEMVICTRVINLSSFTTLSAFTEEKRGGLDRWELLSHWVARVGDTGSRRLKQTFSPTRPKGHPSAARPRSHVSVICDAAEGAEKKRSQGREGRERRYKLFESRVEAEGERSTTTGRNGGGGGYPLFLRRGRKKDSGGVVR